MTSELQTRIEALEFSNARLREQLAENRFMFRIFAAEMASHLASYAPGQTPKEWAEGFIEDLRGRIDAAEHSSELSERQYGQAHHQIDWLEQDLLRSADLMT